MREHCAQILGCPTVSEPQDSIGFTAAAARIPCDCIPSVFDEGRNHPQHVVTPRITFQSMREHRYLLRSFLGPIKIQEIAVRSIDTFSSIWHIRHSAEKIWP